MRDHVKTTVTGLTEDLQALVNAIEHGGEAGTEVTATSLDIVDRLARERAWLQEQPLSSLLDAEALDTMNRYRLLVLRALLLGERYVVSLDAEDVQPWLDEMVELAGVVSELDRLPEV